LPSKRYNSKRSFGTRFNDIKETFEVVNKQIPPDEIASSAVTYEQLEINSIDTTTINYGGISASNFSEGAKIASGESNQRVPSELTDVSYWVQVTSGYAELHKQGFHNNEDIQHVEATSDGILFTPEVDEPARIYLTGRIPIPKSRKVFSTWEADRATNLRLIWWKNSHPVEVTNTFTTAGVATITTATAHGWTVGNEIRVTGLEVDYDGYHTITAVDTFSISYTSPTLTVSDNLNDVQWETRGSVNLEDYVYEELVDKVVWDANYRTANVSNKVLTSNVATLTINASHEFVVGDTVVVGEIDNTFNGTYKITAVTDTTLSYQIVRDPAPSDVVSTAVSPAIQITANDSRSATEYSVYVEIPANDPTLLLESAKVFEVIGYGAKQPLYANVNNSSLTNNVATLTIVDATGNFAVDSSVVVSNVGSPYDGTHIISGVDPASNTFTYNLINANVTSAVANGKAVAYDGKQRSELTPEGLRLYEPNGSLAVDLSTAGNSVFNIYSGGEVVTSIDSDGGAVFTSVDSNSFILDGTDLVGTFEDATFNGYAYNRFNTANVANGESETSNSYLNRLARGSVYEGYTSFLSNFTLTTANTYYTLGSGYFIPSFGRSYIFQVSFGSLNITNNSDEAVQAIIRMGTGPLSIGGANTFTLRSVVGSSTIGTLDTISTQFDTLNTFTSSRVIGKRIQSNVVTLLLEDDTFDGITTDNADKIGVTGSGYPYNGYWDVITSTVATSANVVSYNLAGTARGPNSTSTPRTVTTNINSGERGVFVANTAGLYSGFPLTKVSGTGVFGAGAVVNVITNATHFTTNVNHVTSGTMTFSVVQFIDTSASTAKVTEELQLFSATMPAESPIYYTVELLCPEPNVSVSGNFGSSPATTSTITVSLIDIGQAKTSAFQEISDAGRTAVGSQAPEFDTGGGGGTVVKTVTKVADQSAYYDNYGRGTGTTNPYAYKDSLYQGNPGTASGTKKSAVRFPALGLPAGSTVLKAELYLRNRHSYLSSGLTAYIGAHIDNDLENQTTAPLGRNFSTTNNPPVGGDNADTPDTFSTTFARGQGKWVTLPNSWYKAIADETVRGVLIGLTGVPNTWYSGLTDYGYFDGYEMNDEPKLRITYQYTE
jgi:hypothetical protein